MGRRAPYLAGCRRDGWPVWWPPALAPPRAAASRPLHYRRVPAKAAVPAVRQTAHLRGVARPPPYQSDSGGGEGSPPTPPTAGLRWEAVARPVCHSRDTLVLPHRLGVEWLRGPPPLGNQSPLQCGRDALSPPLSPSPSNQATLRVLDAGKDVKVRRSPEQRTHRSAWRTLQNRPTAEAVAARGSPPHGRGEHVLRGRARTF